ncbi:hypothetical protein CYY_009500 [Polysphondylium violaceum]|uniref:Eukaryotic translation initiation factor 3 subunit G n=1 Tax=Polysphondylium violaceum TaxID=133409 RepID=A0A8J4PK38_9MYCE|nr:hypothetical protein CYY_009500 [Polysphondylium violaceum]
MSSVEQNEWSNEAPQTVEKVSEVIVKNEKGEEIKITKRYQEYQVTVKRNRKADERKKWKKFGECADKTGLENTSYGDEQFLILSRKTESKEEEKDIVKCRICKKNHFTAKCPYKEALDLSQKPQRATAGGADGGEKKETGGSKYVLPSQRAGHVAAPSGNDIPSLMVSNLSDNANEADLRELFGSIGHVYKINIPKTLDGRPKGFAYVTYANLQDAEQAIKTLNGHRYDYLVLGVEFAKRKSQF